MTERKTSTLLWTLAIVISVAVLGYQRMTGPTYPLKGQETFEGKTIKYRLLRTYTEFKEMPVSIIVPDKTINAVMQFRRYKSADEWTDSQMQRSGDTLNAQIPGQPAAGKVEYRIKLNIDNRDIYINKGTSVIARFKGDVPLVFLIPHIFLMFFSFMFGVRAGLETLRKKGNFAWMVNWTLLISFIGGMILGPIVQQYAFGDLWTGFPFGTDLTDNKVLIAIVLWVAAFYLKKKSKWWILIATIVMIIVYLIPHSVLGSELDYKSGKMKNKYTMILNTPPQSPPISISESTLLIHSPSQTVI